MLCSVHSFRFCTRINSQAYRRKKNLYITKVLMRKPKEECKSHQLRSVLVGFVFFFLLVIKFLAKWFIMIFCSFIAVSFQLKSLWLWLLSANYLHRIFTNKLKYEFNYILFKFSTRNFISLPRNDYNSFNFDFSRKSLNYTGVCVYSKRSEILGHQSRQSEATENS